MGHLMNYFLVFALVISWGQSQDGLELASLELPRIRTHHGQLMLEAGGSGNGTISFKATSVKVGEDDLFLTIEAAKQIPGLKNQIDAMVVQLAANSNDSSASGSSFGSTGADGFGNISGQTGPELTRGKFRAIQRRLRDLERRHLDMQLLLQRDECAPAPCKNGGTCIDKYNGYTCLCEKGWEGSTCSDDRDECLLLNGTALACQNGGTCVNTRGGYNCVCPPGWHGIHCTNQHDSCSTSSNYELCGHGTCISITPSSPLEDSYKCICDPGWTRANLTNAPCVIDVDECSATREPCSMDPLVECINTPGSFRCGPCPPGYQGNGITCADINECAENNGGCSKDPLVSCINTIGSYFCGSCPYGYTGDGVTCTSFYATGTSAAARCSVDNGGCSPYATCSDGVLNPYSYVPLRPSCTCLPGYTGSGRGSTGCRPVRAGYGYAPACETSPCKNGGVCTLAYNNDGFTCICVLPYTGLTCEEYAATCGGNLTGSSGRFSSPAAPATVFGARTGDGPGYAHDSNCTWDITVDTGEVVWLKFLSFSLEQQPACRYDYVQIIDPVAFTNTNGTLAKLCGKDGKETQQSFTSSSNRMRVIFVSDSSVNYQGFTAVYSAMDATKVCGGEFRHPSGTIQSPGFPGPYPAFSSCVWIIITDEGSQVTLNITSFDLEAHEDCQADYVEIRNGGSENSPLMGRYCGLRSEMIMKSHANKLYVKFVSDRFRPGNGFQANYYTTMTGCNGVMRAPFGHIASPNYPSPYDHNSECYWHIHVAAGSQIQASMVDFDLENSLGCKYDSLQFFDGRTASSPGIDTFCGTIIPQKQIKSTSNEMHIKFRSDLSSHGRGFHLTYQAVCQKRRLVKRYGVIESPGFPDNYALNSNCDYIIEVPRGNKINASFSHFDLVSSRNCTDDSIILYEGSTENGARVIGVYCGGTKPRPVQTTGNQMYVKFTSGARAGGKNFRLEWVTHGCGGDILVDRRDGANNVIKSPNHPLPYPPNTVCEWHLSTAEYGSGIKLDIVSIDLEPHGTCRWDKLEIFNGPDAKSPSVTSVCHTQNSTQSVTSSGSHMFVRFQSDQSKSGQGFMARYSLAQTECGGNFSTPTGSIESPLYPAPYKPGMDCGWLITVPSQQVVELNLSALNLAQPLTGGCYDDEYLAGYDGDDLTDTLLFKECFQNGSDLVYRRSTSNQMLLQFVTRNATDVGTTGFRVWYQTGCGAVLTATSSPTQLTSPNFPSRYTKNLNCSYIIRSPAPNTKVIFQFTFMDIDERASCSTDYIELRNGESITSPLIGRYCGRKVPPSIYSSSGSLFVRFVTDDYKEEAGWRAVYSNALSSCGGEMSALEGSFTSPGYPNNFPASTECVWTVRASYGNRVDLNFLTFNLGAETDDDEYCNLNYVEVREGGESGAVVGRYCGTDIPTNTTSGMDVLWIMFRSAEGSRHPGFFAEYRLRHGGDITGASGKIASPLHPLNYPHNSTFSWKITTVAGSTIRVTFIRMDMEDRRCHFDYLVLYNGPSFQDPLLGKFCGYDLPPPLQTAGNQLYMIMHTDRYGGNGQGFLLEWEAVPVGRVGAPTNSQNVYSIDLLVNRTAAVLLAPGYPLGLMPNQTYEYRFRATDENSHVLFTLNDMRLGAVTLPYCTAKPRVQITENGRRPLGIFCGPVPTPKVISSQTGIVKLTLETGPNTVAINTTINGFNITYQSVCGSNIYASSGQIESDDHRLSSSASGAQSSNDDVFCHWNVSSDFGSTFDITFEDLDLEQTENCRDHSVTVKGGFGLDSSSPALQPQCGTTLPPAIKTRTNRFEVRYFKKAGITGTRGFALKFQVSRFGCGGDLKLTDFNRWGIMQSPNYPANYPTNIECEWVIIAPGGESVRLDFVNKFEMERHNNNVCPWDFIEVRDGATSDAALLGHICGGNRPGSLHSKNNVMYVKFRSDRGLVYAGFQANYSIATCGGTIVDQRGSITSPGYPQSLSATGAYDCEWTVQAPVGHFIDLDMKEFQLPSSYLRDYTTFADLQCDDEFVEFREGNATGPLIRKLCGSETGTKFSSADSQVFIRFHWSPTTSIAGPGATDYKFRIGYTANTEVCGGTMTGSSGYITSPGFPNAYPHNRVCTWSIIVQEGRRVTLDILEFEIEGHGFCQSDVVELYNGILTDSPRMDRLCGYKSSITTRHQSSTNTMTIKFQTDGSRTNRGFRMRYTSLDAAACGGFLADSSGVITSPNFGLDNDSSVYMPNEECIWKIRPVLRTPFVTTTLTVTHLETETVTPGLAQDLCRNDFIEITSRDAPVQTLCGRLEDLSERVIVIPGDEITLRFRTDYSQNLRGFRIVYNISNCGGIVSRQLGSISSPDYPRPYGSNLNCAWLITAPPNMDAQVQATFIQLNLAASDNCTKDYIQILNGRYLTSPSIAKLCGPTKPDVMRSQGPSLLVQFHSGEESSGGGFHMTYELVTDGCGGILHGNEGIIYTPGFQNKSSYPSDLECIWDIIVDSGYHVNLTFTGRFDIQSSQNCEADYVELLDLGRQNTWTSSGKNCGFVAPNETISTGSKLRVKFRSDSDVSAKGFLGEWTTTCGGIYFDPEGTIVSPGFPDKPKDNLDCRYEIIAPEDRPYIKIEFDPNNFDIEGVRKLMLREHNRVIGAYYSEVVCHDYLLVFGEKADNESDAISPGPKLCGGGMLGSAADIPQPIYSTKKMVIDFHTDFALTGEGFRITYTASDAPFVVNASTAATTLSPINLLATL